MKVIVFYADRPEAGKSTCAKYLLANGFSHAAFRHAALATPLKEMLMTFLMSAGITMTQAQRYLYGDQKSVVIPEFGVSGRHLMRTLGTEWGRVCIGPNAWIPALQHTLKYHKERGNNVVIDDVRHRNEAMILKTVYGATFVKVERPGHDSDTSHSSEGELHLWPADYILRNDADIATLHNKLKPLLT